MVWASPHRQHFEAAGLALHVGKTHEINPVFSLCCSHTHTQFSGLGFPPRELSPYWPESLLSPLLCSSIESNACWQTLNDKSVLGVSQYMEKLRSVCRNSCRTCREWPSVYLRVPKNPQTLGSFEYVWKARAHASLWDQKSRWSRVSGGRPPPRTPPEASGSSSALRGELWGLEVCSFIAWKLELCVHVPFKIGFLLDASHKVNLER